jgi:hypothetical protein
MVTICTNFFNICNIAFFMYGICMILSENGFFSVNSVNKLIRVMVKSGVLF